MDSDQLLVDKRISYRKVSGSMSGFGWTTRLSIVLLIGLFIRPTSWCLYCLLTPETADTTIVSQSPTLHQCCTEQPLTDNPPETPAPAHYPTDNDSDNQSSKHPCCRDRLSFNIEVRVQPSEIDRLQPLPAPLAILLQPHTDGRFNRIITSTSPHAYGPNESMNRCESSLFNQRCALIV